MDSTSNTPADRGMCSRCRHIRPLYFAVWEGDTGHPVCWPCGKAMKQANGRKITAWSSQTSTAL